MFSAWAAIPIRSWEAVIMSAAAEQPPHTLPPPGANFCCFTEGIKASRKRDGHPVSSYFFLGSHWCPAATLEQECHWAGTMWARETRGPSQPSLKHQHISYAGLTPSFLMPETFLFPTAVLPGTLGASISAHGFLLLTLPSVEVRSRHPVWEPVLGVSLFPPQLWVTEVM